MEIRAEVTTDDGEYSYAIDVSPWFKQASVKEIIGLSNIGWGGDYEADFVAQYMSGKIPAIDKLLKYAQKNQTGFECRINPIDAEKWLKKNKPAIANRIWGKK